MTKNIKYDLKTLEKSINLLDDDKKKLGLALLKRVTYLDEKLDQLQSDINANGLNVEMCQGKYSITRANPSCTTYNTFLKQFTSIIDQINKLLPKIEDDGEGEFVF